MNPYLNTDFEDYGGDLTSFYLDVAYEAIWHSRFVLHQKSTNKYREGRQVKFDAFLNEVKYKESTFLRAINNTFLLQKTRDLPESKVIDNRYLSNLVTEADIKNRANLIKASSVGNCYEYSVVAADYLLGRQVKGFEIVALESGEHGFLVLGTSRPKGVYFHHDVYGSNEVIICDPWTKIACLGSEYLTKWNMRMRSWEASEKKIQASELLHRLSNFSINYRHIVRFSCSG